MRSRIAFALFALLAATPLPAASKPHVVALGRWQTGKRLAGPTKPDTPSVDLKIRSLYVDTKLKENTVGPLHEVTDHVFVVRRTYRVTDSLPGEDAKPRWQWHLGGWLQVDRVSGHVSALNLPEFDPEESSVTWYRDYAAYCGVSDDGKTLYALVAQVGRRKPDLKRIPWRSLRRRP